MRQYRRGSACEARAGLSETTLYDSITFCVKVDLLQTEKKRKIHKTESVVSDEPARTVQADLKGQFTQMAECAFSRVQAKKRQVKLS